MRRGHRPPDAISFIPEDATDVAQLPTPPGVPFRVNSRWVKAYQKHNEHWLVLKSLEAPGLPLIDLLWATSKCKDVVYDGRRWTVRPKLLQFQLLHEGVVIAYIRRWSRELVMQNKRYRLTDGVRPACLGHQGERIVTFVGAWRPEETEYMCGTLYVVEPERFGGDWPGILGLLTYFFNQNALHPYG